MSQMSLQQQLQTHKAFNSRNRQVQKLVDSDKSLVDVIEAWAGKQALFMKVSHLIAERLGALWLDRQHHHSAKADVCYLAACLPP